MFEVKILPIYKYNILRIKKVDYNIANQRFDRYLRKYFKPYPEIKLSDIYSWIRKWMILVNNKKEKEDYRLILWDEIKFNNIEKWEKKPKDLTITKENKLDKLTLNDIKKMIIFEDKDWVVFDKPAGVVAHPGNQHINDICMNDYLEKYCEIQNIAENSETFKPSFGYRLDKDTSGVLIWAKNYDALQYLNEIIRDREIDKEYKAIVEWEIPKKLIVEKSIEKVYDKKFGSSRMIVSEKWLSAKSEFYNEKTIEHNVLGKISLVWVRLYTGRMHQIRIHLASEWFSVLWDITYWNPVLNRKMYKQLKINRQMLHCSKYSFKNLDGKKISFESKLPQDFKKLIW
jgi:23S rRNA pseudouridine955/2504/2580 synthase